MMANAMANKNMRCMSTGSLGLTWPVYMISDNKLCTR